MHIKYKNSALKLILTIFLAACSSTQGNPTLTSTIEVNTATNAPTSSPATIEPTSIPPEYPKARGSAQLHFHPPSGKMIMFGGESNQRISFSDTWEYDPATNVWAERFPETHPEGVGGAAAVYDSESDKFIFYFSTILDRSAPKGLVQISETWAYDFATNTWENMNPVIHPVEIMGARLAYDSEADRMILFGGADFTADQTTTFTETWTYDYNSNTWQKMNPSQTPIGRSYFGMAYAPDMDLVFVFGGRVQEEDEDRQNELWAYDYNTDAWLQINYFGEPKPDHHSMMAYNAKANQLWYLANNELISFDLNTMSWENIASSPTNSPTYFHAMAIDSSGNLILFGGGPQGLTYNNKSYVYSLTDQAWESLGP